MERMTDEQAWAFLATGSRPATFATVRDDGRPHATPTWYLVEGRELTFTTWHETVKAANLRRDPRISLVVQDPEPPYDYVAVEGEAALADDPAECRRVLDPARREVHGRRPGR